MALISFDPKEVLEYVPEYGGNRGSEDPCVVRLKFVSHSRVEMYRQKIRRKSQGTNVYAKVGEIQDQVQKEQFCDSIESIEGFIVKGEEVTSPEEFYELAPDALVKELINAMEDCQVLDEGQRKNLQRVSGGASYKETGAHSSAKPAASEIKKTETAETDADSQKKPEH